MGKNIRALLLVIIILVIFGGAAGFGALADRIYNFKPLDLLSKRTSQIVKTKELNEESVVIDAAQNVSPSVVTVSIQTPARRVFQVNPFGGGFSSQMEGGQPQDIGTGFIVSTDGLIVTNKHVVSDTSGTYKVVTKDNKEYPVKSISRDPANDIAVLKIDAKDLKPIALGDSGNLKVGQFVIAIGTALGQFRDTVTTGVISGLGRGITAGDPYQGYAETLDNIIQTDAAINPGNSGGPLLNSSQEVIGINVAVAQGAQNIGFALPVNIVKQALADYKQGGGNFQKAYLGVEYQMISQQAALLNSVPQGAYVINVVSGSPAEKVGIKTNDIITKAGGTTLNESTPLSGVIAKKKPGDKFDLEIWRDNQTIKQTVTLEQSPQ